jgi:hypothetical protein
MGQCFDPFVQALGQGMSRWEFIGMVGGAIGGLLAADVGPHNSPSPDYS